MSIESDSSSFCCVEVCVSLLVSSVNIRFIVFIFIEIYETYFANVSNCYMINRGQNGRLAQWCAFFFYHSLGSWVTCALEGHNVRFLNDHL
jgi:hypothetical protein